MPSDGMPSALCQITLSTSRPKTTQLCGHLSCCCPTSTHVRLDVDEHGLPRSARFVLPRSISHPAPRCRKVSFERIAAALMQQLNQILQFSCLHSPCTEALLKQMYCTRGLSMTLPCSMMVHGETALQCNRHLSCCRPTRTHARLDVDEHGLPRSARSVLPRSISHPAPRCHKVSFERIAVALIQQLNRILLFPCVHSPCTVALLKQMYFTRAL